MKWYLRIAGIGLVLTGAAKIVSACLGGKVFAEFDPILQLPYGTLFLVAGGLELAVGVICLASPGVAIPAGLVAWLSTTIVIYRCGLVMLDYKAPCSCLGTFTDALQISPAAADGVMKVFLSALVAGSYYALFIDTRRPS